MRASAAFALDAATVFFNHALEAAAVGKPQAVIERLAANGRGFLKDFFWYSAHDEGDPPRARDNGLRAHARTSEEDCYSCDGCGHFDENDTPTFDKRNRKCPACWGKGRIVE